MRVVNVEIPPDNSFGLQEIRMGRLGKVVVLAGKNGAGKSRLLQRLANWMQEGAWPYPNRHKLKRAFLESPWGDEYTEENIEEWLVNQGFSTTESKKTAGTLYDLEFDSDWDSDAEPNFVFFVPKQVNLTNQDGYNKQTLLSQAKLVENLGVSGIQETALARIQQVQDRWWNATHQHSTRPQSERDEALSRYQNLASLIYRFVGDTLDRDQDDRPTLFGYPIGDAPLSDGQKILLQFCVAIHAQADKLSELIVLMDEPENHLHPGAMLDAISQIESALTDGQLWIATHSIPLLAHFDPDDIWWMEEGGVAHAGSMPEKVLASLLGDDERIARLNDFLGLPAALASTRFAQQCLLPPAVLNTGSDDPQTLQIARLLSQHRPDERLRLLDIGAGRGRLISALREGWTSDGDFTDRFDYRAYDPDPTHRDECEAAIARVYGDAAKRAFHDDTTLRETLDPTSVDVAIMCNVLHEIDVTEWLHLFSERGTLRHFLRDDGYLCLIEDTEMRIGEQAHQRGFLVLDTAALKTLFAIGEDPTGFLRDDARGDGRLQAHLIPKAYLANATHERLRKALLEVRQKATTRIKELRSGRGNASYRDGRRHAFHVQQLANAQLGLDILGESA